MATLLAGYDVSVDESWVKLSWSLSSLDENVDFVVMRKTANGLFRDVIGSDIARRDLTFVCRDTDIRPGESYWYRVDINTESGRSMFLETERINIPEKQLTLFQNWPNPFNPETVIRYYLPADDQVVLEVFNVAGKRVTTLVNSRNTEGYHNVRWDGRNSSGDPVSSGVYIYRLRVGNNLLTKKMTLMR